MISRFLRVASGAVIACTLTLAALPRLAAQPAATINPALYSALKWRMVGPFRAGRVNAISGVIGQPNTFYFGSVGGGVWKSTNIGRTWTPIFDANNVASIGAIAVAPSNPDVLYVGTGEADMRDSIAFGDGMYKSTDAGKTWKHIGLESTRQIGKVIVHPRDPNIVFVAALGHVYGPHPDRGVYRSRDGGATWQKVLFKGDSIGAIDLAFDPSNPQTVFAAMWAVRRPPWFIYTPANGPGSGLFKSVDGGTTWSQLTNGLPTAGLGRMGIAIAPANPRRVYVIADAKEGGLFRSDDGGATFTRTSGDPAHLGPRLVLHQDRRRSEERRRRLCAQHRRLQIHRRRPHLGRADQGVARRRRLPPVMDRAGRSLAPRARRRPGSDRLGRRRPELELLVQPADRAALSRCGGLPFPVLADGLAAG